MAVETKLQRESLMGKIGRVVATEKGKDVIYEGPIIHERFVQWNDIDREAPEGWQDYWRVTIGVSPDAIRTSGRTGKSISVAEAKVQIVES